MVKHLIGLESTNQSGTKQVHVWVVNDGTSSQANIEFSLAQTKLPAKQISLNANEEARVSVTHSESGLQMVVATDLVSGKSSQQKPLDLDKDRSF